MRELSGVVRQARFASLVPGILLTGIIAFVGIQMSAWIGNNLLGLQTSPVSGITMAIIVGLLVGNLVPLPAVIQTGVAFSLKKILRIGIILLGIRLVVADVVRLGLLGIPLIALCLLGALLVTRWLGNRLSLSSRMSALVAVGTSICGATAIVATAPAIDARDEETAYAIANITVFGIIAMLLYPYLAHTLFPNDPTSAGLFIGTSIHETAQVAGSGLIYAQLFDAPRALDVATIAKLVRNVFMIGVIPLMAYLAQKQQNGEGQPRKIRVRSLFPTFILGFLALALVRTAGDLTLDSGRAFGLFDATVWGSITGTIRVWAENFLTMAMAGVGLATSIRQIRKLGVRPFIVGFGAAIAVGVVSLVGIELLRHLGI